MISLPSSSVRSRMLIFLPILVVVLWLAFPQQGQAAFVACCCKYEGTKNTGQCQNSALETNQYCKDVLGASWVSADDSFCALNTSETEQNDVQVQFTPSTGIPGTTFSAGVPVTVTGTTLGEWISAIYVFLSGSMGILAALMVMFGGFKWLTAGGNSSRVSDAKDVIYSAVIALLLTFGAYILLRTINPQLVQIQDLTSLITKVVRIDLPIPLRISEAFIGNPGETSVKNQFNAMVCPTLDEMRNGFEGYLTGYYRPGWQEAGGYPSFLCNVGMQCSCKPDTTRKNQCSAGGFVWTPCDASKITEDNYCNETASGGAPINFPSASEPYTAAASPCFGDGTRFTVSKTGATSKVYQSEWFVQDRGRDIQGRHFDLFTGTGERARAEALSITGRVMIRMTMYCLADGTCTPLN